MVCFEISPIYDSKVSHNLCEFSWDITEEHNLPLRISQTFQRLDLSSGQVL